MDTLFNSSFKEKLKDSIFLREEIQQSLNKIKVYLKIMTFALTLRLSLSIFSSNEKSNQKIQTIIFVTTHHFLTIIFFNKVIPYIEGYTSSIFLSPENISKAKTITEIFSSVFMILAVFGILVVLISPIKDGFLRGISFTITSNSLQYFSLMIIRNPKISLMVHIAYIIGSVLLFSNPENKFELIAKLIVGNLISLLSIYQNFQESKGKSGKYVDELYDKNNIFKTFLQEISDCFCLRSIKDNSLNFQNHSFIAMKISEVEFTFSGKDIYNNESTSLSNRINELLKNEKSNLNMKNIFHENFNLDDENQTKMFSVLAMKIEKNNKQYLGVYIKDITKTVDNVSKNTTEIVSNRQICTISHELKTPINQSLGLLSNVKHLTTDEECKSKLRLLKSSLYKLDLKVDEFLEYGKTIEQKFKAEISLNKISSIFKELMIINFDCICQNKLTFEFIIDPKIEEEEFPIDARKLKILIQQYIDKVLENKNLLKIVISAYIKDVDLLITIKSFIKFQKTFAQSSMKLNEFKFNSSKSPLQKAESRANLSDNLIPLIMNITGIQVNESINDNIKFNEIRIKIFDETNPGISPKHLLINEENQKIFVNKEFGIMRPKRNTVRLSKTNQHSMKFFGRNSFSMGRQKMPPPPDSKVLVVDDNQMNRFPLCEILKSLSIHYEEAENGQIALDKYLEITCKGISKFLILMDLDMPIMDGITASRKIREIEKEKKVKPIPIIAVSAYDSEIEIKKALNSGMNAFYKKPLKKSLLQEILNKYLLS